MTFQRLLTTLPALLLAGLALPCPTLAQEAPQGQELPALDIPADLAGTKNLAGVSFPEAYKRVLLYSAGANYVYQRTVGLLLEAEIERQRAAGLDLARIEVTDEEVEARIQKKKGEYETQNRDAKVGFWGAVQALGFSPEAYRLEVRQMLILDRLFFPDDPDLWPEDILKEAFEAGKENSLWDSWVVQVRDQLRQAKEEGNPQQVDETMRQLMVRPRVIRWLMGRYEIREPFHGLPEGVALEVAGRTMGTDELLVACANRIGPVEKERALAFTRRMFRLERILKEKGWLLTPEQCLEKIAEEKKEYENSPISYEQVALEFQGFPSMELYHQWYRLRMSFRQSLPEPFPLEMMQEHLEQRALFLGGGKADAEVILLSARNPDTGVFAKTGDPYAEALERAQRAAKELADGAKWGSTLVKYSDFPESLPGGFQGAPQPRSGRFGPQTRNQLRQFLGENDYTDFLGVFSVADHCFFRAELATIYGPVRGAFGWYIYKLKRRLPPEKELDLEGNERHRYLVGDDLLSTRFLAFVAEAMGG